MKKMKKMVRILAICFLFGFVSCEDKNDEKKVGSGHDPSKPVTLTSFYPDEGGLATRIIINGSNFGSNPDDIRVWYNKKRAKIIGSDGDHLYVVTPRQPGDTCTIAIVVGSDSVTFEQPFIYHTSTTVSTIAGHKGTSAFKAGTLSTAEFSLPQRICVDAEGNIFGSQRTPALCWMLNEAKDIVMQLPNGSTTNMGVPTVDITGRIVTFPDEVGYNYYVFDADLQWAGRTKIILRPDADEQAAGIKDFTIAYKGALATCQLDSMIYFYEHNLGYIIKFNPLTRKGQSIDQFISIGYCSAVALFHPVEKHILYIALIQKASIYTYNILTGEFEPYAGTIGVSGWRDGPKEDAYLGEVGQMLFDEDLNLIFSDASNHCIRKITPDGQVSTLIGMPKVAGYVDGNPEDAMFNYPRGMCIDKDYTIYISDTNNNCIRKLSVE
jgi:hypothetical protein